MRKLIYIMGCAHCGSTLLTTLLSRHSLIATVGELKMTAIPDDPEYLCGCGVSLLECKFWKDVANRVGVNEGRFNFQSFGTHFRTNRKTLLGRLIGTGVRGPAFETARSLIMKFWPPAESSLRVITEWNQRVIDAVCTIEGKPVFLDGSKDPIRLLHFAKSGRFDVKGIHLVRDGRAILASHKKRSLDSAANIYSWSQKTIECERTKSRLPEDKVLTLRYEDLCENVEDTLCRIFKYIGVHDESSICKEPGLGATAHIIGHNSRLGRHKEIRLSREWEKLLTPNDLVQFSMGDPGLNQKYGYPRAGA